MIVIDASVLANALGDDHHDGQTARDALQNTGELAAPDLINVETLSALRRRRLTGDLTHDRLHQALNDLANLPLIRYPTLPLLHRALELANNLTPYDAVYIALAEGLNCPLITSDQRLTTAPGPHCTIHLLTPNPPTK